MNDRDISLFSRAHDPMFAGINTFLKAPYAENIPYDVHDMTAQLGARIMDVLATLVDAGHLGRRRSS